MKVTGVFFAWAAGLYYFVAGIYWLVSHEIVGSISIGLTGGLATIVAVYLLLTARRIGELPEDQPFAEPHQADSEYGFFSPHSWWPMAVGLAAGVVALGFVFAAWLLVLGVVALLISVAGWQFEYYRGEHVNW